MVYCTVALNLSHEDRVCVLFTLYKTFDRQLSKFSRNKCNAFRIHSLKIFTAMFIVCVLHNAIFTFTVYDSLYFLRKIIVNIETAKMKSTCPVYRLVEIYSDIRKITDYTKYLIIMYDDVKHIPMGDDFAVPFT